MHNISKKEIKEATHQLAQAIDSENSSELLEMARVLHEKCVLFHHSHLSKEEPKPPKEELTQDIDNDRVVDETLAPDLTVEKTPITPERELTVQERIEQIMAGVPKFDTISAPKKPIVDKTEKPTTPLQKEAFQTVEKTIEATPDEKPTTPIVPELAQPKEDNNPFFSPPVENDKVAKFDTERTPTPAEESSSLKASLEEEFKDAISADYAAELFEKAEKAPIKKSLNDQLSQNQIQIGLNDRIAFVKHLFGGNQADFNRVLSQLNSFSSEAQAKHFINMTVKPDYNWANESDYEERLMTLIERRFL